jgi:hypothetical protein
VDIDRGCRAKKAWFDKAEAKRIAQDMTRRYRKQFHLYRCPHCAHDHVGHLVPAPVRAALQAVAA